MVLCIIICILKKYNYYEFVQLKHLTRTLIDAYLTSVLF